MIFFSVKPLHVTERNKSLCNRHQNIALKFRALKPVGAKISVNSDTAAKIFPERTWELPVVTIDEKIKIHSVVGNGKGITGRYQSCYCKLCFENWNCNFSCSGWNFHQLNSPSFYRFCLWSWQKKITLANLRN